MRPDEKNISWNMGNSDGPGKVHNGEWEGGGVGGSQTEVVLGV